MYLSGGILCSFISSFLFFCFLLFYFLLFYFILFSFISLLYFYFHHDLELIMTYDVGSHGLWALEVVIGSFGGIHIQLLNYSLSFFLYLFSFAPFFLLPFLIHITHKQLCAHNQFDFLHISRVQPHPLAEPNCLLLLLLLLI